MGGAVFGLARGAAGKVLHVAQVPTRSDVRRLSHQLTVLTGEIRALKLAQQQAEHASRPKPRAPKAVDRAH